MNIHEKRTKDMMRLLEKKSLDGIIVTTPIETYFFSGFHQDRTILLITKKEVFAFIPKMFLDHFKETATHIEPVVYENLNYEVVSMINKLKLKKTVFDPSSESYTQGNFWASQGLKAEPGLVSSLRLSKQGEELACVEKACKIAVRSFDIIKPRIRTGVREMQICAEMENVMRKMGAMGKSFELIIAFGPNSALPHHETSERKLRKNEAVLMDFGCVYGRYCSDITRTFFYGRPGEDFKKVYSIVDAAQKAGVAAVKDGAPARDIDGICRDYISEKGYGQYFTHGTGHGVGLQIHEEPYLNTKSSDILREGMTVTVEPGIYLYGKFGVRIEDTVYVGKKGPRVLTK